MDDHTDAVPANSQYFINRLSPHGHAHPGCNGRHNRVAWERGFQI
jgi:hypothetical protein